MYWKILRWGATVAIIFIMAAAVIFAPADDQSAPKQQPQQQGKKFNF